MPNQIIIAEEVVSITEIRKQPTDFFTDHPIAVLNKNQIVGYMVGKELFESMVDLIRQLQPQESFIARFQPSAVQLTGLVEGSTKFLAGMQKKDFGEFNE